MAETIYNAYKADLARGDQPWETGDYRVLLLRGTVTIDPDHATVAAVLAANDELDDASYSRRNLAGKAVTQNDPEDRAELDADTVDFEALDNETPTAMLVFLFDTDDANSTPVTIHDSGFGAPANGAGYTVAFPNDVLRFS
jgi:hypothetical protein